MTVVDKKRSFIHREICSLCFIASFGMALQHPFYSRNANREVIKKYFKNLLFKLLPKYSTTVSEKQHVQSIENIFKQTNKKFANQLAGGGITFGRTQKLVNLYLKFMWVIGFIKEPPHCPIDSVVIAQLGPKFRGLAFTTMKKDKYLEVISEIKKLKGKQSISEWELNIFNNR